MTKEEHEFFDEQRVVCSPRRHSLALAEHARRSVQKAFAPHDSETAQYQPIEQSAEVSET